MPDNRRSKASHVYVTWHWPSNCSLIIDLPWRNPSVQQHSVVAQRNLCWMAWERGLASQSPCHQASRLWRGFQDTSRKWSAKQIRLKIKRTHFLSLCRAESMDFGVLPPSLSTELRKQNKISVIISFSLLYMRTQLKKYDTLEIGNVKKRWFQMGWLLRWLSITTETMKF